MKGTGADAAMFDAFARLGTATVYEAAGRRGLIDLPLHQIVPGSRVAGPARTVQCGQDDNLMAHAVMERVRPGDIVILTMPEPAPVALVGELLATQAQVRGAAGMLIDASVRDLEELIELGLPIWARFIRVRGATKAHVGKIDVPVAVGGADIHPGDVVVLDADGAAVVERGRTQEVLEMARARLEHETRMRVRLRSGELSLDLLELRRLVEEGD